MIIITIIILLFFLKKNLPYLFISSPNLQNDKGIIETMNVTFDNGIDVYTLI